LPWFTGGTRVGCRLCTLIIRLEGPVRIMNFDLAQTPTLQAVAAQDEQELVQDLQQRVDSAAAQADAHPGVVAAALEQRQSEEQLQKLRRAERALHSYARQLAEKIAATRETALDALIESMSKEGSDGDKPGAKPLNELFAMEGRSRQVSMAIQKLVEQRIPLAQIRALREESHAMMTKVKALEEIARERAEKLLGSLREAVSEEVVLPVDLSKGVSGALLHQASEYKQRAIQLAANADELERAYMSRAGK